MLAILLVAMAAAQLSDIGGFRDIVASYGAVPRSASDAAALALVAAELVAGLGLLDQRRGGGAAAVALMVTVVWGLLGAQAFTRGLALHNCGCFGVHLAQSLWWGVLVQDAVLIAAAGRVLQLRRTRTAAMSRQHRATAPGDSASRTVP